MAGGVSASCLLSINIITWAEEKGALSLYVYTCSLPMSPSNLYPN